MHRTSIYVSLLLVALAGNGCSTPEPLRVGAWNIEWLGVPDRRYGDAADVSQQPEDLASYVTFANVAVLGLAEINANVRREDVWTNDTLEATFALVSAETGGRWRHRLFPDRRDGTQVTGLAWDETRVTPVGEPIMVPVSDRPGPLDRTLWSRPPWAQKFTTGEGATDFVVIMLHQKSNYGGDYTEHRGAESADLVSVLPEIRRRLADEDIIIIGDTNCSRHDEPGVRALVSAGFIDLNAHDAPTHFAIERGGLDRAYVPAGQDEFRKRAFWVPRDGFFEARGWTEATFRSRCSDHYMVVTEIETGRDDD